MLNRADLPWSVAREPRDLELVGEGMQVLLEDYGYLRSMREGAPVDREGRPIPYFTYPAIDYLRQLDLTGRRVFEYGSGYSSLFWARAGASVRSVDHNEGWAAEVRRRGGDAVQVSHVPGREANRYASAILEGEDRYDVVVIDGIHRLSCVPHALSRLTPGGLIIVDNSEWSPRTNRRLRDAGLIQVDFFGLGPAKQHAWVTSLFLTPSYSPPTSDGLMPAGDLGQGRKQVDAGYVDIDVSPKRSRLVLNSRDDAALRWRLAFDFDESRRPDSDVAGSHRLEYTNEGYGGLPAAVIQSAASGGRDLLDVAGEGDTRGEAVPEAGESDAGGVAFWFSGEAVEELGTQVQIEIHAARIDDAVQPFRVRLVRGRGRRPLGEWHTFQTQHGFQIFRCSMSIDPVAFEGTGDPPTDEFGLVIDAAPSGAASRLLVDGFALKPAHHEELEDRIERLVEQVADRPTLDDYLALRREYLQLTDDHQRLRRMFDRQGEIRRSLRMECARLRQKLRSGLRYSSMGRAVRSLRKKIKRGDA